MLNGYKTMTFALVLSVLGALETFNFTDFLNESTSGVVVTIIGAVIAVLRYVTKSPVFNK